MSTPVARFGTGHGRGFGLVRQRPHIVRVSMEYGDDDTGDVGFDDAPFRTWDAAANAIGDFSTGPWAQVPLETQFDGSTNSASPVATYTRTAKFQLASGWTLAGRPWARGDPDRSRASVLLSPSTSAGFAGPLVESMGRYTDVSGLCMTNPHASGVGWGIGTTQVGGGFQSPQSRGLSAFGCGLAAVRLATFNLDALDFYDLDVENNPGFGVLVDDLAGTVDLPNHLFFRNLISSNNATGTLPSPFTGKGADVAVLGANASPNAAGEGLYIDGWKGHGLITRLRVEGGHNVHVRRLYWENNNDQAVDTPQVITRKGTGSGGTAPTHYVYNLSLDEGRIHGLTHSGWTAGVPLFGDFDECVNVLLGQMLEFHQTDATAANPLVVLNRTAVGGGVQMIDLQFGVVTSTGNRANRVTTAAALAVIGALSATCRGTYYDGANWPVALP